MGKLQLTGALLCSIVLISSGFTFAHAAAPSGGIDTPTGVANLPLAVEGQQAIIITADPNAADVPSQPSSTFSGPIGDGGTTIAADGSVTIGSNLTPQPASVLNVTGNVNASGNITAPGTTTIVGGVSTTTGGNVTASGNVTTAGNITTSGGYLQPAAYADTAQPSCGPTNRGALIYSTTQNTALVCNGSTGQWVGALGSSNQYAVGCTTTWGTGAFAVSTQTKCLIVSPTGATRSVDLSGPAGPPSGPGPYAIACSPTWGTGAFAVTNQPLCLVVDSLGGTSITAP